MLGFFNQIVLSLAKENLLTNMTKYQIACRPCQRPSEHIFVLKSVFNQYKNKKKGLILSSFDIQTFFDSEDIYDVFSEVYAFQVKGKVYRILFKLNENTTSPVQLRLAQISSD